MPNTRADFDHDPAMLFKDSYAFESKSNVPTIEGIDANGQTENTSEKSLPNTFFHSRKTTTEERKADGRITSSVEIGEILVETTTADASSVAYRQWVAQAGQLVADLLVCAGTDHIITMDLHDPQFQGFFDIPVDNLFGRPLLQKYIVSRIPNYQDAVIVSPDAGGAKRATAIADALGMDFALIHKERKTRHFGSVQSCEAPEQGHNTTNMILVGNVTGKAAVLIDDLVDTSRTLCLAAELLKESGATSVWALVTHGILSGDAVDRVNESAIDRLVVSNSAPQDEHLRRCSKLEVFDVVPVFAEAIRRTYNGESVSLLFDDT